MMVFLEVGKALRISRAQHTAVLLLSMLATAIGAGSAAAADCPGNPGALGTSRTLVVDPREHPRIGAMQYAETLPLEDHEVVLTFDDGPLPPHSTEVLDILASGPLNAYDVTLQMWTRPLPPFHLRFAIFEALAHLEHLKGRGELDISDVIAA